MADAYVVKGKTRVLSGEAAYSSIKASFLQMKPIEYIAQKDEVRRFADALALNKPVLIEGPPGIGKTVLVETMARKNGYTLQYQLCSEGVEETALVGVKNIHNLAEGTMVFVDGSVSLAARASQEGKVICFLDEVSNLRPETMTALNGLLDQRHMLMSPVELEGNLVNPENFRFAMAYNPSKTKKLLDKWIDRSTVIRLSYPHHDTEVKILLEVGGLKEVQGGNSIAEGLVKLANEIRRAKGFVIRNGDAGQGAESESTGQVSTASLTLVRDPPSTRLLVDVSEYIVQRGMKFQDYIGVIVDNLLAGVTNAMGADDAIFALARTFIKQQ